jgi:hypothetical protein
MNLADEQLVAASKAMFASSPQSKQWREIGSLEKQIYLSQALAAAPFLQMPWDEPTRKEATECWQETKHINPVGVAVQAQMVVFVRRRNASLIPKPVDPRREKILGAMRDSRLAIIRELLADRILAALDAKE